MYAPKDDRKHRAFWRALYSPQELTELQSLITACASNDVHFIYAIAPGLDVQYSSSQDKDALVSKLTQLLKVGCRHFALLFDDIPAEMNALDAKTFESFAEAQCHISNRVLSDMLRHHDSESNLGSFDDIQFLFCPTEYCGMMATPSVSESPYLNTLGTSLHPKYHMLWTGPTIVSETIPVDSLVELRNVIQRKPVIWDNIHANDYDISRMYLGPYQGRSKEMLSHVKGILTNPNCEFELDFMAFRTLSLYLNPSDISAEHRIRVHDGNGPAPRTYVPRAAYFQALSEWLVQFHSSIHSQEDASKHISFEDLVMVGDLFYLPHEHGAAMSAYMILLQSIVDSPPTSDELCIPFGADLSSSTDFMELGPRHESDAKIPSVESTPAATAAATATAANATAGDEPRQQQLDQFESVCHRVGHVFECITELDDRDLCYSLYQYMWGIKEECLLHAQYVHWLYSTFQSLIGRAEDKPTQQERNHIWQSLLSGAPIVTGGNEPSTHLFRSGEYVVGTYRGGSLNDLHRLLHLHPDGHFTRVEVPGVAESIAYTAMSAEASHVREQTVQSRANTMDSTAVTIATNAGSSKSSSTKNKRRVCGSADSNNCIVS
jgi:beta-N-acetylglucosaminidase